MYKLIILFLFVVVGCMSTPKRKQLSPEQSAELSQAEAEFRAKKVRDVDYDLYFDLTGKSDIFKGTSQINFNLVDNTSDLRVDFHGGKISLLKVNNLIVQVNYNQHYLIIDSKHLVRGQNSIKVGFSREYSRNGRGLYKFTDPIDHRIYLYSNLQPFDANKIFPSFDQPNLKARYTMKVMAPKEWKVVTSVLSEKKEKFADNILWSFPQSDLFSTYIWSLHAGPYHIFTDSTAQYPTRLFVRQSLKKYVKTQDWFTYTRQGFEFFNEYFGYEYPYKKYDQLIVPDFNLGAMENVAAVTFSEKFVKRGRKTISDKYRLAEIIFHEMAHMWFGNLVTMNWWDDLWLNESFATYIATYGISRHSDFKDGAWRAFRKKKNWALWEDQLVTTHPIEAVVPDTTQAFANFDGITYGKGGASLKQLHYRIGDDAFKRGVQLYFKRYARKNTTLKDFVGTLNETTSEELSTWQKKWLQTTGVNTVSVDYKCDENKITKFTIQQDDYSGQEIFRPHTFQVAIFGKNLKLIKSVKVSISEQKKEIKKVIGMTCPTIVYPNYNDHDYLMVKLDDKSLYHIEKNIDKIENTLLRQVLWQTLWEMVYYGHYSYLKYYNLIREKLLGVEGDHAIIKQRLATVYGRYSKVSNIISYINNDIKLGPAGQEKLKKELENQIWKLLMSSKFNYDLQKVYFEAFLEITYSRNAQKKLHELLINKRKIPGLKIDQDKRWDILVKLSSFGFENIDKLIDRELKRDKSSMAKKKVIAARASSPVLSHKMKWINAIVSKKNSYSLSELKVAMQNLFPKNQLDLRGEYQGFFNDLLKLDKEKDVLYARLFTSLSPMKCNEKEIKRIMDFVNSHELSAPVKKQLRIIAQENSRCHKVISDEP